MRSVFTKTFRFALISFLAIFLVMASAAYPNRIVRLSTSYGADYVPKLHIFLTSASSKISQSTPEQQTQQGRLLYLNGQYIKALASWEMASQQFEQQGNIEGYASVLSNRALAQLALGLYDEAEETLLQAKKAVEQVPPRIRAQVLSADGQLLQTQGRLSAAMSAFHEADKYYQIANDASGRVKSQLNQALLAHRQGLEADASRFLQAAWQETLAVDDTFKASRLRQLGQVFLSIGEVEKARTSFNDSLAVARDRDSEIDKSMAFLALGNLENSQNKNRQAAVSYYKQAEAIAPTASLRLQTQVNLLSLVLRPTLFGESYLTAGEIDALLATILEHLDELAPGRQSSFIKINLIASLIESDASFSFFKDLDMGQLLSQTLESAHHLQDKQIEAYALGYLGQLYETRDRFSEAVEATQRAILISAEQQDDWATYRWYWQLGRTFKAQQKTSLAVSAYEESRKAIERLQDDVALFSSGRQFSAQREIEPVYRELASLLLTEGKIKSAQKTIVALQKTELINFFRADCIDSEPVDIATITQNAQNVAVVQPVMLSDRVELILQVPGDEIRHTFNDQAKTELSKLEADIEKFRQAVSEREPEPRNSNEVFFERSQPVAEQNAAKNRGINLYKVLIKPIKPFLPERIDTLVFILDGSMRNIPMAALYDEETEEYLIEQYAIALSPGLELPDRPQATKGQNRKVLFAGLTDSVNTEDGLYYQALTNVQAEKEKILTLFPESTPLLNDDFTKEAFENKLNLLPFPIVHIATHAEFGRDLDSTFVLTHDGKKISASELSSWLQFGEVIRDGEIDLLVLSACETAKGSDLEALGLAGVAVRSGARSTLATLWRVGDASTAEFMSDFYTLLKGDSLVSKAKHVQQAQINLLRNEQLSDPYYWAPFVLIGDWL